jgi:hypothetical protein
LFNGPFASPPGSRLCGFWPPQAWRRSTCAASRCGPQSSPGPGNSRNGQCPGRSVHPHRGGRLHTQSRSGTSDRTGPARDSFMPVNHPLKICHAAERHIPVLKRRPWHAHTAVPPGHQLIRHEHFRHIQPRPLRCGYWNPVNCGDLVAIELHSVHDDMRPVQVCRALRPNDMKRRWSPFLLTARQHEHLRRGEVRCGASLIDFNERPHPVTQGSSAVVLSDRIPLPRRFSARCRNRFCDTPARAASTTVNGRSCSSSGRGRGVFMDSSEQNAACPAEVIHRLHRLLRKGLLECPKGRLWSNRQSIFAVELPLP